MARASALLLALLWVLAAAASEEEFHGAATAAELAEHAARTSSRDVKVPLALVSKVEKDYDAFLTHAGVVNKGTIRRALLNVRADLKQKRPGALHENARVVTPLGGGVVDLGDLVTPVRGAFSMKIEASREHGGTPENMKVFFVSRAKQRIVGGDEYGAGCDKWMDITGYFKKLMGRDGFQLYTADQRYLSVVGGTFVIVGYSKEAIEVGSISFTDSRYPQVLCDVETKKSVVE